jgi:ParB family chromosome partitioning protein
MAGDPSAAAEPPSNVGRAGSPLEVPIEQVSPGRAQPRRHFDEDALEELAASIRETGIIQPLVVMECPGGYELIAGERRLRAASRAGLETVPVVVKRDVRASELVELALIENIQRSDLTPIEEAKAYEHLVKDHGYTQEKVAQRVGKSRAAVANSIRLLTLPASLGQAVEEGKLSEGHARALLGLATTAAQVTAARKVIARGLSVRETEELVRRSGETKTPPRKSEAVQSATTAVEKSLGQVLGTKVRIRSKARGGRIEIEYYSQEELNRLLERLGS